MNEPWDVEYVQKQLSEWGVESRIMFYGEPVKDSCKYGSDGLLEVLNVVGVHIQVTENNHVGVWVDGGNDVNYRPNVSKMVETDFVNIGIPFKKRVQNEI